MYEEKITRDNSEAMICKIHKNTDTHSICNNRLKSKEENFCCFCKPHNNCGYARLVKKYGTPKEEVFTKGEWQEQKANEDKPEDYLEETEECICKGGDRSCWHWGSKKKFIKKNETKNCACKGVVLGDDVEHRKDCCGNCCETWQERFDKEFNKPVREDIRNIIINSKSMNMYWDFTDIKDFIQKELDNKQVNHCDEPKCPECNLKAYNRGIKDSFKAILEMPYVLEQVAIKAIKKVLENLTKL